MRGRSFILRGYGARVRLDVPEGMDISNLRRYVAPEITIDETKDGPADLFVTRWDGVYHLVFGERRYGPYRTSEKAFRSISNGIHFALGRRSPMTFIHAGAIELDGAAVIFPGRSRWGKSTLVSSLVDQGCGYLSDEYAVISSDGSVFPLSRPIHLRSGGNTEYRMPQGVCAPGGLPCGAVVLTRYEQDSIWNPKVITRGDAVIGILPTALLSRDAPHQVLSALTALVREAPCYQGVRGDGKPTLSAVRNLVGVTKLRVQV
jgi:hypothetical protein